MHFLNNFDYTLQEPWPAAAAGGIPLPAEALAVLQGMPADLVCRLTLAAGQQFEVTAVTRTAASLVVQRGVEGTVARSWPAGTRIYAALTAGVCELMATGGPVMPVAGSGDLLINYQQARNWVVSIQGDTVIALSQAPAGMRLELLLIQPEDSGYDVDLPAIDWPRGSQQYAVDTGPGSVTRCQFTSVGPGRWIGDAQLYGEAPKPPAQELFAVWFYADSGSSLGNGPYFMLLDSSGVAVLSKRPAMAQSYSTHASVCTVSADNLWAAAYAGANTSPELVIINVQTGAEVTLDVTLKMSGPEKANMQFAGGMLYCWDNSGLLSIDPATGQVSPVSVPVTTQFQAWSISDNVLAMNYNGTTAGAVNLAPVVFYDLVSGTELAEQLPLPAGGHVGIPSNGAPSPFGAAGAFSGDGSMYALCVNMRFGAGLDDSEQQTKLVIYGVAGREVVHTIDMPPIMAYGGNVVWSRSGRYVAASHDANAGSTATVFDLETLATTTAGTEVAGNSSLVLTDDGVLIVVRNSMPEAYSAATGQVTDWPAWLTGMDETDPTFGLSRRTLSIASTWR